MEVVHFYALFTPVPLTGNEVNFAWFCIIYLNFHRRFEND